MNDTKAAKPFTAEQAEAALRAKRSDVALRDIRDWLLKQWRMLPLSAFSCPEFNAGLHANVAKGERTKFKRFLVTVDHFGDADLVKTARKVGVSKELLDKWMNTPKVSICVNNCLSRARRRRARRVVHCAKVLSKHGTITRKAPWLTVDGKPHPDCLDYGNTLTLAKQAAAVFENSESFSGYVADMVLMFHKHGGLSSARQFFIDLGKCLSSRGTGGIKIKAWEKEDVEIADIILSYDPPLSDKDAVRELQNRGHWLHGHLPMLETRFRTRKHRLIRDAHSALRWLRPRA
jgi:hypothetical protein